PEEPPGFRLHRQDLSFRRVRVHTPAAEGREVLGRSLEAVDPLHPERRLEAVVARIDVAEVAEARVAVAARGEPGPARAPQAEVLLRRRGAAPGAEHIEIPVVAPKIDPSVGDGRGRRDGLAERSPK